MEHQAVPSWMPAQVCKLARKFRTLAVPFDLHNMGDQYLDVVLIVVTLIPRQTYRSEESFPNTHQNDILDLCPDRKPTKNLCWTSTPFTRIRHFRCGRGGVWSFRSALFNHAVDITYQPDLIFGAVSDP